MPKMPDWSMPKSMPSDSPLFAAGGADAPGAATLAEPADRSADDYDSMAVPDARTVLGIRVRAGDAIECPVCGQTCKRYKRKLNSAMAACLVYMYRYFRRPDAETWLHVEKHIRSIPGLPYSLTGDFPKLRFWDLICPMRAERDDQSDRVGYWRITEKGRAFVEGRTTVPRHVFIYGNVAEGFSADQTTIGDALGDRFNYAELMQPAKAGIGE